jgi:hypothetical protein
MRQAPQRLLGLTLLDTSAQADSEATGKDPLAQMVKAEHDLPEVISNLLPRLLHASHLSDAGLVAVITTMANSLGRPFLWASNGPCSDVSTVGPDWYRSVVRRC